MQYRIVNFLFIEHKHGNYDHEHFVAGFSYECYYHSYRCLCSINKKFTIREDIC